MKEDNKRCLIIFPKYTVTACKSLGDRNNHLKLKNDII